MKKNRSFLVTWNDDESEDYKGNEEQDNQLIALAVVTLILESDTKHQELSKDVATNVRIHVVDQIPHNPPAHPLFEEEEDDILGKEPSCSYTVLYKSWVNTVKSMNIFKDKSTNLVETTEL